MKRKRGPKSKFDLFPPLEKELHKLADSELTDEQLVDKLNVIAQKRNLSVTINLPNVKHHRRNFLKSVDEEIKAQKDNLAIIEKFGKELGDNGGIHVLKTIKMVVQNMVAMISINMNSTGELLECATDEARMIALQKGESMTRMLESLTRTEKNMKVMVDKVKEEMAADLIAEAEKQELGSGSSGVDFVKRLIEQVNANKQ